MTKKSDTAAVDETIKSTAAESNTEGLDPETVKGLDEAEEAEAQRYAELRGQAELFIATVRLIDTVVERGAIKGSELTAVASLRATYISWLEANGFIQEGAQN